MPTYVWKGTQGGATKEGTVVAKNKDEVRAMLGRQNIVVSGIKEKGKEISLPKFGGGVSQKEIAVFTKQFSVMIDAGLPMVQCLEILGTNSENATMKKTLLQVRQSVEGGASLSDSLAKHPKVFDNLFHNLIRAGEAGGILDTILRRLSDYIEKSVKLKGAVRSALIYPITVIGIAVTVVWVILTFVIPTFAELFSGLGVELPLPTRIVMVLSHFMARYTAPMIVMGIIGATALKKYHATYNGRRVLDQFVLKIPVMGYLMRLIGVARFCRTLGTLTASGVPILEGLEITAKTSGNAILEDAIMSVRKDVEQGKTISEPLKATKQFPNMMCSMLSVGEKTGALDTMLNKVADFYEDEVDEAVENLMALLEPIMIVFLGAAIGGIVIAMYLPMFKLISVI